MSDILVFATILCCVALVAVFVNKRLLVLVLSSVFVLLVAMRLSIPSMYLMGTVLLALPVASWFVGWYGAQHLQFTLIAPESAFEGEEIPIRVDVESPLPAFSVLAQPSFALPDGMRVVDGSETAVSIPSGVRQESMVIADRSGVYDLDFATVLVNDPLGIFIIKRRFSQHRSLIVYPTGLPMPSIASQGHQNAGRPTSARVGQRGDDEGFYGTREYRHGDDLRRIHWRSSARHGSLVVAERESHMQSTIWICLDSKGAQRVGGAGTAALERCVKAAVTIMEAALGAGDAVGLQVPGTPETFISPKASEDQRWRILDSLARVHAGGNVSLEKTVVHLEMPPRATVAMVTPLPTPGMAEAAVRLVNSGAQVTVVYVEPPGSGSAPDFVFQAMDAAAEGGADTLVVPCEG